MPTSPISTAHAFDALHKNSRGGPPAEALRERIKEIESALTGTGEYSGDVRIMRALASELAWRRTQLSRQGG